MEISEKIESIVSTLRSYGGRGVVAAYPNFGKTKIMERIIELAREKNPSCRILVISPLILNKNSLSKRLPTVDHMVINTAVRDEYSYDIVLVDEAHLYLNGSEVSKVLDDYRYGTKNVILFSGTFSNNDLKYLYTKGFRTACNVQESEGIREGWINPSRNYALMLELNKFDRETYQAISNKLSKTEEMFKSRNIIYECSQAMKTGNIRAVIDKYSLNIYGNPEGYIHQYQKNSLARLNMLTNKQKLGVVANLCNELHKKNLKVITFGRSKEDLISLTDWKKSCCIYHGMTIPSGYTCTKKALDQTIIDNFNNNRYQIIHTIKKADLGLNLTNVGCSIIYSRDGNDPKSTQRHRRSGREQGSHALNIDIVFKDTIDEIKFRENRRGYIIMPFENVESLIETINV